MSLNQATQIPLPPTPTRQKLPAERESITHKFQVGELEGYMIVGLYPDGRPGELFITASKQGSTLDGLLDTIGMLTSYALQYNIPLQDICTKLKQTRFEPAGPTTNRMIPETSSIVDYIFRWLELKFLDPVQPATFDVREGRPAVDVYDDAKTIRQL